jgi:hypothetical protein
MRELLTGLVLASCLLPIAAAGMRVSSYLAAPIAPHRFADTYGEPLWSPEVRRVDPSLQAYERIPAVLPENTLVAEAKSEQRVNVPLSPTNKPDVTGAQVALLSETLSAKAREWCGARYRSYNAADNTYQPYGGGPRRACAAPIEADSVPIQQVADGGASEPSVNERWCMERYTSYRIEDNTYQPFSGGRKVCSGPISESANNSIKSAADATVAQF